MKRMVRDNSGEISPKRVALYLRTSSLSQARDGYGLEMQERSLRALVESNAYLGWVTNDDLIYREDSGMSGAS